MCTRPDRRSVSTSFRALCAATVATLLALGVLLLALVSAPVRFLRDRRPPHNVRPATVAHIDVQVHLEDAQCVTELKRLIRHTLRRAARTWAPLPLPIQRVVVGVGFPVAGRVDLYDDFPREDVGVKAAPRQLVVVSLGLREGDRELEPAEVAGALAAQIQAVIDERYRQQTTQVVSTTGPSMAVTAPRASAAARSSQPAAKLTPTAPTTSQPLQGANGGGLVDPSLPRLQELLATVQQGQPLDAAGPSSNGTHP